MTFQLRRKERLPKGLRRIVQEQFHGAIDHADQSPTDEAVHDARKRLKRVRAILRMVRPAIKKSRYRKENNELREIARPLSSLRDAQTLIETLEKVSQDAAVEPLRQELATRKHSLDDAAPLDAATSSIQKALRRVSRWTRLPDQWPSIGKGLKRSYRQARQAFADAIREPTTAKRHEWRKQVKYLRYQLQILGCERKLDEQVAQLDKLGDLLGEDHDFAVLIQTLAIDPNLRETIDRRRNELLQESQKLAERIFQDSPKNFARRVKQLWKRR
jgi:CHAD domain-containing protein